MAINNQLESYSQFYHELVKLGGEPPLSWIGYSDDPMRIESEGYQLLMIDRMTPNYISLTLCSDQAEGDEAYMRNPQVVFEIRDNKAEPVYYFNDNSGEVKQAYTDDSKTHFWPKVKRELEAFCITWFQNLHEQGYFDKAKMLHDRSINRDAADIK